MLKRNLRKRKNLRKRISNLQYCKYNNGWAIRVWRIVLRYRIQGIKKTEISKARFGYAEFSVAWVSKTHRIV